MTESELDNFLADINYKFFESIYEFESKNL